jgi:hypothetical protein
MLKVIIPDPGLREYGGHHPAMVDAIANTQAVIRRDITLEVYCNKACANDFIANSQSKQVTIKKHFNTDFYQYFYQSKSLATLNSYINQLSKEYLCVFEKHTTSETENKASNKDSRTLFLYHTLNGEHATALGAAIAIYNKRYSLPLQHCVFLMFNPIKHKHKEKDEFDNEHFINFKVGFSLLAKQKGVKYYASEGELQQNYQHLFTLTSNQQEISEFHIQTNKEIAIHPCGLLNKHSGNIKKSQRVILFTGDAKINKGFSTLPDIVGKVTGSIIETDVEFIIQYTITNDSEELKKIDNCLQLLAEADSRIKLITRFWSHVELHENFAKANSIVFNYDSAVYQNQSSGVLWLAASYNLNMIFLTSNWLMREAEKLDCQFSFCNHPNLSQEIRKYFKQNNDIFDKVLSNKYRKLLFQDMGEWLLKESLS